jgi:hypothetical protein
VQCQARAVPAWAADVARQLWLELAVGRAGLAAPAGKAPTLSPDDFAAANEEARAAAECHFKKLCKQIGNSDMAPCKTVVEKLLKDLWASLWPTSLR